MHHDLCTRLRRTPHDFTTDTCTHAHPNSCTHKLAIERTDGIDTNSTDLFPNAYTNPRTHDAANTSTDCTHSFADQWC